MRGCRAKHFQTADVVALIPATASPLSRPTAAGAAAPAAGACQEGGPSWQPTPASHALGGQQAAEASLEVVLGGSHSLRIYRLQQGGGGWYRGSSRGSSGGGGVAAKPTAATATATAAATATATPSPFSSRIPSPPAATAAPCCGGAPERAPPLPAPAPLLLAEARLIADHYSIAVSRDGSYIAAGALAGWGHGHWEGGLGNRW